MRVLIDGYNLQLEQGTGVATYARGLSHLLRDSGHEVDVLYARPVDPDSSEMLREIQFFERSTVTPKSVRAYLARLRGTTKLILRPTAVRPTPIKLGQTVVQRPFRDRLPPCDRIWNQAGLFETAVACHRLTGRFTSINNKDLGVAVAHWTYPLPLRVKGVPNIVTIHDLVPLRLPYTTIDHKRSVLKMYRTLAERADLIVTVSESSRRDIIEILNVPEERVVNTYQTVSIPADALNTPDDELARALRGVFGLERGRYILAYGAVEPKKNFGRLIEAYLTSDMRLPLVIAGPDGWLAKDEMRLRPGNERRVMRVGYVPFRQLVNLVRGATCLAMPSLYEGFGLPIVEAMTCGTPVVTSDLGATAEIAGDAAALVDPYDVASIRAGLRDVCLDADRRAAMIERGHAQRQRFSAEACKRRLAEAYAIVGIEADPPPINPSPA